MTVSTKDGYEVARRRIAAWEQAPETEQRRLMQLAMDGAYDIMDDYYEFVRSSLLMAQWKLSRLSLWEEWLKLQKEHLHVFSALHDRQAFAGSLYVDAALEVRRNVERARRQRLKTYRTRLHEEALRESRLRKQPLYLYDAALAAVLAQKRNGPLQQRMASVTTQNYSLAQPSPDPTVEPRSTAAPEAAAEDEFDVTNENESEVDDGSAALYDDDRLRQANATTGATEGLADSGCGNAVARDGSSTSVPKNPHGMRQTVGRRPRSPRDGFAQRIVGMLAALRQQQPGAPHKQQST